MVVGSAAIVCGVRATYDTVIIGGGVIGSAVAYFLAASPDYDGRVLVVERDRGYGYGSTGRSVGGIRQQFSTPENIRMSLYGAAFIKRAAEYLAVDGEVPGVDFVEAGYLYLATPETLPILEANNRVQRELGADVRILGAAELGERFPWLDTADLAAGALGFANEGWLDPHGLLQGFRRKARHLGVDYVEDEVVALGRDGARVRSVRLAQGGALACGSVVNAAGARAADVAAMARVALPVRPRKRQVFVFHCRERLSGCPLVIDPSGLYFRPEGPSYICGIGPPESRDPDCEDFEVDFDWFEAEHWPRLARRVPAFEAIKLVNAWAGHYAYNTFDQNAILGCHPEVENFVLANGFSGHGLQQSPAAGRAVAELLTYGEYRSLDLSRFGYARIVENRPARELNVV